MSKVQVELNGKGVSEMLNASWLEKVLLSHAENGAARARNSAPVDTGDYKSSIFVVADATDRVVARIGSRARHGMIVEAMTGNLARALGSAK